LRFGWPAIRVGRIAGFGLHFAVANTKIAPAAGKGRAPYDIRGVFQMIILFY